MCAHFTIKVRVQNLVTDQEKNKIYYSYFFLTDASRVKLLKEGYSVRANSRMLINI